MVATSDAREYFNKLFYTFGLFLVVSTTGCFNDNHDKSISIYYEALPYSADPIDYDDLVHHIGLRSVLSPLVSNYKLGNPTGVIAESWSANSQKTEWTFKIRDGLKFEDGESISAEVISKSFHRIAYLLKQKKSGDGLLEWISGLDQLKSPDSPIAGLSHSHDTFVLKFRKPMPKVIDLISYGLYSVVSPKNYDMKTGKWLNKKSAISSGHYSIESWSEDKFNLALRPDFLKSARHNSAFQKILISNNKELISTADMLPGFSVNPLSTTRIDVSFFGGAMSGILYVNCRSWALRHSPCYSKISRVNLREYFYSLMANAKLKVTRSFFPVVMKGVAEFPTPTPNTAFELNSELTLKYRINTKSGPYYSGFNDVLKSMNRNNLKTVAIDVPHKTAIHEYTLGLNEYEADLYMLPTNILIDDPYEDVRFMFRSREGINLPDPTGAISKVLENDNFDIQLVNRLIYEEAIVWPVTHFSLGFWATQNIDVSQLNLLTPPIDFAWIGHK